MIARMGMSRAVAHGLVSNVACTRHPLHDATCNDGSQRHACFNTDFYGVHRAQSTEHSRCKIVMRSNRLRLHALDVIAGYPFGLAQRAEGHQGRHLKQHGVSSIAIVAQI